tara:strand:- start:71 stop:187 length:117 start_codon:yes stop_codon:yes gene_type:complete
MNDFILNIHFIHREKFLIVALRRAMRSLSTQRPFAGQP